MKPLDWRFLTPAEAAGLHDAEAARWLSALHWDTRASLKRIESARRAGNLPGLVVRDEWGAVRGWTFFLVHDGVLQIGGFVADSIDTTVTLLDAVLRTPAAAPISAAMLFAFSAAPDLLAQLARRGFIVERYRYLEARMPPSSCSRVEPRRSSFESTTSGGGQGFPGEPKRPGREGCSPAERFPKRPTRDDRSPAVVWTDNRLAAAATLLGRSYTSDDPARPFARGGRPHEWLEYATQLVSTKACGTFLPEASFVAPGASPAAIDGVTLMTRLTPDTAHVAQMAVAPEARGRGLARQLLTASLAAAHAAGCARATLLVSERNAIAGRLYEDLGFEEVTAFISAACDLSQRSAQASPAENVSVRSGSG
jgi:GNAT superfamily N-acetyltransferase